MRRLRRPLFALGLLLVVLVTACTGGLYYAVGVRPGQVTEAIERDLEAHLPVGSSEEAVRRYFAARGEPAY